MRGNRRRPEGSRRNKLSLGFLKKSHDERKPIWRETEAIVKESETRRAAWGVWEARRCRVRPRTPPSCNLPGSGSRLRGPGRAELMVRGEPGALRGMGGPYPRPHPAPAHRQCLRRMWLPIFPLKPVRLEFCFILGPRAVIILIINFILWGLFHSSASQNALELLIVVTELNNTFELLATQQQCLL